MAGIKGKSGRHKSDFEREGFFFRLRPEVMARVERCTPLLELQEGVTMSKAEALEHLLTMACEALERTREDREASASISEISEISNGISALHELVKPLHLVDEDIPFDEDLAPASHTNSTGAPAPQPPTQPAIPLALEPAPTTAQPVDVPQTAETVTESQNTEIAIPPYDATKYVLGKLCPQRHEWGTTGQSRLTINDRVCPECRNALKRRKRAERHQGQPA
jgi:hypothetical protein